MLDDRLLVRVVGVGRVAAAAVRARGAVVAGEPVLVEHRSGRDGDRRGPVEPVRRARHDDVRGVRLEPERADEPDRVRGVVGDGRVGGGELRFRPAATRRSGPAAPRAARCGPRRSTPRCRCSRRRRARSGRAGTRRRRWSPRRSCPARPRSRAGCAGSSRGSTERRRADDLAVGGDAVGEVGADDVAAGAAAHAVDPAERGLHRVGAPAPDERVRPWRPHEQRPAPRRPDHVGGGGAGEEEHGAQQRREEEAPHLAQRSPHSAAGSSSSPARVRRRFARPASATTSRRCTSRLPGGIVRRRGASEEERWRERADRTCWDAWRI